MVVDRRGEAHLWLLLEEALVNARSGVEMWEVRRNFRAVADALAATRLVPVEVGAALAAELADALAVRNLIEVSAFTAHPFPADVAAAGDVPIAGGVAVWLEAELEHHLELLAAQDPTVRPGAGAEAVRALSGPVRAFEAAGALGSAGSLVADFVASVASAGYDVGRHRFDERGRVRREWVRFLRERTDRKAEVRNPTEVREPSSSLGQLHEWMVRVDLVSWSDDVIHVGLTVRRPEGLGREDWTRWHVRALDERGRLHLGPPGVVLLDGGSTGRFVLRPGLPADASRLQLRVTTGGHRVEGTVSL